MTMVATLSIFRLPTCRVFSLNSPMEPKKAKNGCLKSLGKTLASLATLLLMSVKGAPVSKIIRYGPLPLILTWMAMCCVFNVSKGTVTGFSSLSSGKPDEG